MSRRSEQGFTLTELLVTVVIISILLGIAVPSYRQYVIRSKRTAAQAAMMDIANREQQFLLANRAYADKATLEANGYVLPAEVSDSYSWSVKTTDIGGVACTAPCFSITFTGAGGQANDNSPSPLTLTSTGDKSPAAKWKR